MSVAVAKLSEASGTAKVTPLAQSSINQLTTQVAIAAGVPVVTEAVGKAWRLRGGLATGWPVLAWVAKFKPDPLRRLHLDRLGVGRRPKEIDPSGVGRTSLPETSGVQKARVDTAVRTLADQAAQGLTRGWADEIRRAARSAEDALPDRVDRAVATTDLDLARRVFPAGVLSASSASRGALVGTAGSNGVGCRRCLGRVAVGRAGQDRCGGGRAATYDESAAIAACGHREGDR